MPKIPDEICAVVFDEPGLCKVLGELTGNKIGRIGVDESGHHMDKEVYTLHLKDDTTFSYTEDQLAKLLTQKLGRKIINISLEQRKEFYVRFRI
ncbi:MAG: hypothetical protein ABH950_03185 [Candidatus Altiarchaeota archaeon]